MDEVKLKECACCGGRAEFDEDDHGYHWVTCVNCGISTDAAKHAGGNCHIELAAIWNRRPLSRSPETTQGMTEEEKGHFDKALKLAESPMSKGHSPWLTGMISLARYIQRMQRTQGAEPLKSVKDTDLWRASHRAADEYKATLVLRMLETMGFIAPQKLEQASRIVDSFDAPQGAEPKVEPSTAVAWVTKLNKDERCKCGDSRAAHDSITVDHPCFECECNNFTPAAQPGDTGKGEPHAKDREAAIRERLAKATPGPWYWEQRGVDGETHTLFAGEGRHDRHDANLLNTRGPASLNGTDWDYNGENNRALIAHAPTDLLWCLDELTRVRGERDSVKNTLEVLESDCEDGTCRACVKCHDALEAEVSRLTSELTELKNKGGE